MRLYNSCRQFIENHMIVNTKMMTTTGVRRNRNQFFILECGKSLYFFPLLHSRRMANLFIMSLSCLYVLDLLNFFVCFIMCVYVCIVQKMTLMRNIHVKIYSITSKCDEFEDNFYFFALHNIVSLVRLLARFVSIGWLLAVVIIFDYHTLFHVLAFNLNLWIHTHIFIFSLSFRVFLWMCFDERVKMTFKF